MSDGDCVVSSSSDGGILQSSALPANVLRNRFTLYDGQLLDLAWVCLRMMIYRSEQVPGNGPDPSAWSVPSDDGHSTVHCTLNRGPNLATAGEETADFRGDSGTKQRCAGETNRGRPAVSLLLSDCIEMGLLCPCGEP